MSEKQNKINAFATGIGGKNENLRTPFLPFLEFFFLSENMEKCNKMWVITKKGEKKTHFRQEN